MTAAPRQHCTWLSLSLLLAGSLAISGCMTPAERIDQRAVRLDLTRHLVQGTHFKHVVYASQGGDSAVLHVYLEGDGSPWLRRDQVAADPTPRRPVMFELFALDSAQALYLGRPCYHGQAATPPCGPWLWTHGRYSTAVVDSLEAALRSILEQRKVQRLRFFGFSGGGAVAVLLAKRFNETEVVVTVAGNLDPRSWTRHHGYSALTGSLNPTSIAPLPARVRQIHLLASRDKTVPPFLIEAYLQRQHHSEVIRYADFDHRCCWRGIWISLLAILDSTKPTA